MTVTDAIADEIVMQLNQTYTGRFVASRQYRPRYKLEDLVDLAVTVSPRVYESQAITRSLDQFDHTIEIGVQQRTDGDQDDLDQKTELVEEIANSFRRSVFTVGGVRCHVMSVQVTPMVALEHLDELNVFSSVVALKIQELRDIT